MKIGCHLHKRTSKQKYVGVSRFQKNLAQIIVFADYSKGPFTRSDFKDPILGSENWTQAFRRYDFKVPFLSAPFIFQEEYRTKIEHVLFPSVFPKLRIRVSEGHIFCTHKIRFSEPTKIGLCERA